MKSIRRDKNMKCKLNNGFTLIELMVVISIITMIFSMSYIFFRSLRTDNIKHAGQMIKATFMRASQLASAERRMYFIAFDKKNAAMSFFEDVDDNKKLDKTIDKQVGETIALPKGTSFSEEPELFQTENPYVGFNSNGTLSVDNDLKFDPPKEADIILLQENKPGKLYLDFQITTGRVNKTVFMETDDK